MRVAESRSLGFEEPDGVGDALLLGFGERFPPGAELVRVLDLGQSGAPRQVKDITSK